MGLPSAFDGQQETHRTNEVTHLMGILWALIVLLFIFWIIGFAVHLGGGLIHLVLVVAVILLIVNLLSGRGARV
jgi:hydrogenase-4 membrane subunit HyfE